ncbi:hypothetical protein K7432_010569 [Basidiobolus ranarum]|uniref:DUF6787 domain-containing protein n=1 Tax=Basidiobolus ranarum TaxID=34480 RepID=A0ABR2VW73_9FUNG
MYPSASNHESSCSSNFSSVNSSHQDRKHLLSPQGKELIRWSWPWWKEYAVIMTVFSITGSSTMRLVRLGLKNLLGIEGTLRDGPWTFRGAYLATSLPLYSCILITVGTLFGRRLYFQRVALRMWSRFIPKKYRSLSQ